MAVQHRYDTIVVEPPRIQMNSIEGEDSNKMKTSLPYPTVLSDPKSTRPNESNSNNNKQQYILLMLKIELL